MLQSEEFFLEGMYTNGTRVGEKHVGMLSLGDKGFRV